MVAFTMPSLGADMTEGTIVEWLVAPGDDVARGQVVAVVDTDKAAIDAECWTPGVVRELLVGVGDKVAVGTPLAEIVPADVPAGTGPVPPEPPLPIPPLPGPPLPSPPPLPEPAPVPTPPPDQPPPPPPPPPWPETTAAPPTRPAPAPPVPEPPVPKPRVGSPLVRLDAARAGVDLHTVAGSGPNGMIVRSDLDRVLHPPRVRASPYARRIARERGVDLAAARGTGPDGLIRARDLPSVAPGPPPAAAPRPTAAPRPAVTPPPQPAAVGARPGADPRRATAALMARSKREIPHYYLSTQVDLAEALDRLRAHNRAVPVPDRILPAALLLSAAARALRAVPELNGHWVDDAFHPADHVQLGVAVAVRGGGLTAPVIHDADTLDLLSLMAALAEVGGRARAGHLRSSDVGGATATVTNLGDQGVDAIIGVIHPPQVALVGIGAVRERPWAVDGAVVVRPVVDLTLAADHRATDGATGARLLREMTRLMRRPDELVPPADPAPTDPAPTKPAPTDPAPTDPAPTDPAPTDPAPAR